MDCVNNQSLDRLSNAASAGTPPDEANCGLKHCQEISVESSSSVEDKIVNVEGWSHSQSQGSSQQQQDENQLDLKVVESKATPLELNSIIEEDNENHENTRSVREDSPEPEKPLNGAKTLDIAWEDNSANAAAI